jgi:nitrilase
MTETIDAAELVAARCDFDVSGHYSRPDVFTLSVDESPQKNVAFHAS